MAAHKSTDMLITQLLSRMATHLNCLLRWVILAQALHGLSRKDHTLASVEIIFVLESAAFEM